MNTAQHLDIKETALYITNTPTVDPTNTPLDLPTIDNMHSEPIPRKGDRPLSVVTNLESDCLAANTSRLA